MDARRKRKNAILAYEAKKLAKRSQSSAIDETASIDHVEAVSVSDGEDVSNHDDSDSGEETSSNGQPEPVVADEVPSGSKVKKSKVTGLYKPPTHDELQSLKETQDLFSSNLMRMQITELLSEVRPKKTATKPLEEFLHTLKETLVSLPSSKQVNLCDGLSLLRKKVRYPLNLDLTNTKGKFQFFPPSVVKVIGGFLLGTLTKPDISVDVALHIPVESLQAKDHLNYRYFHKRALFLSLVAGHLNKRRKTLGIKSLHFSADNPLMPILVLTLEGSKVTVHLHTSISDDEYFKRSKLLPDRNNVRCYYLSSGELTNQSDEFNDPATPHYNASLLVELGGRERHLHTLYSCLSDAPNLVDAVLLCKVWVRQRGLDKGYGCFSGFHFSMLLAWLCTQKKVNKLMSSYQVFRIIMQTLVSSDWATNGLSMAEHSTVPLSVYHTAYEVVFLDGSGLNICADVSKEGYTWLKHEASLALCYLDDESTRGFQALFMTLLPPLLSFDTVHTITSVLSPAVIKDQVLREAIQLDGAAWPLPLLMSRVLPILYRGLGQRVKLLTVLPSSSSQWPVSESPPTPCDDHVTIGLLLDTDHAFSVIDVGPPSDSSEAVEFREFWGQRSELRRFQDGSINEAVVWAEPENVASRRTICHQVIQYLLERHAGLHGDCVSCSVNCLDSLISLPSYSSHGGVSTGEAVAKGVVGVVTELGRDLRQLRDLPLSITSVQGVSPAFRHTEVFPLPPWNGRLSSKYTSPSDDNSQSDCYFPSCDVATPPYIPAYEVVCQLESSGKWPEDVEAITKIKISFYTYISKALSDQKGLVSSPTREYLDVLKGGYVFRIRIHYHREVSLLKEAISTATGPEEASLKRRLFEIENNLVSLPILTSCLNGLHQRHPAFAPGARLCKRWVSAHLLANHIADEIIELIVAYLFVHPAPYSHPGSPLNVFLRFLSLILSFDWSTEPLIVNFNSGLTGPDVSEIVSKFTSTRSTLPSMVIATPTGHAHWSTPSAPLFARLQLLARGTFDLLSTQLERQCTIEDVRQSFRPPLDDYHVLIHLHKRHAPRHEQAVDAIATGSTHQSIKYKHEFTHLPVVDFDPVQKYLRTLEVCFSDFALFFHDKYGESYVAVAWKPSSFTPQPFKVMHSHCHMTGSDDKLMVPDTKAIISDFEILGEGLVKHVEVISLSP